MEVLDDVDILSWLEKEEPKAPAFPVKSAHADTLTSQEIVGTSFEIQREILLVLLEKAISVVPTRNMIPVLTNFQLKVTEGKLEVIASSLDMAIVVSTNQVDTKIPGTEVLPAKTLLTIVKEANAGSTIFIEVSTTGAVIVAGGFSAEIRIMNGSDFPPMDILDNVVFHEVQRQAFIDAITNVKYALPGKDHSGLDTLRMIHIRGGKFTACDGSRFQQVRVEDFKLSMQLPTYSINTIIKTLSSTDQEILEIGETKGRLVFRLNNVIFYVNKLDDPYPKVEQLWLRPALSNDQEFIVNRQELITAIKQVKVASDSSSNAIGLIIENEFVKIVAKDIENSASVVIPCKWTGKPKTLAVNYLHLVEMLKAYSLPECRFLLGKDTQTHKASILLKNDDTMAIATIPQMLAYRVGL